MFVYDIEDRLRERFHPPEYSMLPATASEAKLWNLPYEGRLWTIRQKYPAGWSILEVATTDTLAAKYLNIKQTPVKRDEPASTGDVVTDEQLIRSTLQISKLFLAPDKENKGRFLVKRWSDGEAVFGGTLAEIGAKLNDFRLMK